MFAVNGNSARGLYVYMEIDGIHMESANEQ
jgi:hypothetical protein